MKRGEKYACQKCECLGHISYSGQHHNEWTCNYDVLHIDEEMTEEFRKADGNVLGYALNDDVDKEHPERMMMRVYAPMWCPKRKKSYQQ